MRDVLTYFQRVNCYSAGLGRERARKPGERRIFPLTFIATLISPLICGKGFRKTYRKSGFLRFLGNSRNLTLYCRSKHFNFSFHDWKQWWTDLSRDIMWASLYFPWLLRGQKKVFQLEASAEAKSEGKVGRFESKLPAPWFVWGWPTLPIFFYLYPQGLTK